MFAKIPLGGRNPYQLIDYHVLLEGLMFGISQRVFLSAGKMSSYLVWLQLIRLPPIASPWNSFCLFVHFSKPLYLVVCTPPVVSLWVSETLLATLFCFSLFFHLSFSRCYLRSTPLSSFSFVRAALCLSRGGCHWNTRVEPHLVP